MEEKTDSPPSSKKRGRPSEEDIFKGDGKEWQVSEEKGLEVQLMKEDKKKDCNINKMLPQPPFLMSVVAQRASGKTNMVIDLLTGDDKLCGYFDLVFIWSTSYKHDSKWKNIKVPCEDFMVFEKFDPGEIQDLFETLQTIAKTKVFNVLFVFDDMIDQNVMHPQKMETLESIAVRGRHYNISVIMISQLYKKLSNPMRVNSTNLIFFRIRNRNELLKVVEENQESLTKKEFISMYNFATKDPFTFLHVNNQATDPSERFRRNWNSIINIKTSM